MQALASERCASANGIFKGERRNHGLLARLCIVHSTERWRASASPQLTQFARELRSKDAGAKPHELSFRAARL